ncbi:MAG: hypothetical protein JWP77_1195 [Polaromonas sp.]|jgi:hypothetical protein|nr:hypothetical protein [Polaromonas sp.]MDB5938831.1 hypothetical protein [Polaromonas sp.]
MSFFGELLHQQSDFPTTDSPNITISDQRKKLGLILYIQVKTS